ncbi:MAG: SPOR domain-containing protein [Candidatus Marinimicrobia bacterium]|nr:SPOR domain-containing protein [Candidatus Neomarinimicrobiota bacterium]
MKQLAFISFLLPLLLWGQRSVGLDESFDPTSLNDWADSKARIERIKSLQEYFDGLGDLVDTVEIVEYSDYVYRVQLGSTNDYDAAIAFETRAAAAFEEDILVQFDSPYYKIRVGMMNNREEAQKLQQYAIKNGYRRAWVIRTKNIPYTE